MAEGQASPLPDSAQRIAKARSPVALAGDKRVQWLRANAHPIRSVDMGNNDFSDLDPIRRAIGNARIVMLGEETHGDGTTFLAKGRLVRFLHERMGFDVLAIESGFYDVSKTWEHLQSGEDPLTAIGRGVFLTWTALNEIQPLVNYLGAEARGPHPLELAGVDDQLSGMATLDFLGGDLREFLTTIEIQTHLLDADSPFRRALEDMSGSRGYRAPGPQFVDSLVALEHVVASRLANRKVSSSGFWVQALESFEAEARDLNSSPALTALRDSVRKNPGAFTRDDSVRMWTGAYSRDLQMGKNLVWLATHNPKSKIIVWAASVHLQYDSTYNGIPISSMGGFARRVLGASAVYQIGFIPNEGVAFNPVQHAHPWPVEHTASSIELEDLLHATGMKYAFLDLRHLTPQGRWLEDSLYSRPAGNTPRLTQWPKSLDGFFFIDTLMPATVFPPGIILSLRNAVRLGARNNDITASETDSLQTVLANADLAFREKRLTDVIALLNLFDSRLAAMVLTHPTASLWQQRIHGRVKIAVDALHSQ